MKLRLCFSGRNAASIVSCLLLGLVLCPALWPATAFAQNVIVNGNVADVYGNSPDLSGTVIPPSPTGSATGHSVTVNSGGTVTGIYLVGGYVDDNTGDPVASGNRVVINSGGTVNAPGAGVFGGLVFSSGHATATDNSVLINGGRVDGNVYGGQASSPVTATATASGNSVTIINGGGVSAGVYGGLAIGATSATASGNSVFINGSAVAGYVAGGRASSTAGSATASGNSVFINGGRVDGNVYGGSVEGNTSGTATYNIVTISGSPDFTPASTQLVGGQSTGGVATDIFTGNTLNVWNNSRSISVAAVYNFEFFNFRIPSNQSGPVLAVANQALLGDGAGRGSTVTAVNTGGSAPIPAGSSVTLIQAGTLDPSGFNQTNTQGQHGATIRYLWALDADDVNGTLTATAVKVGAVPETKVLSEGYVAGLALVNQGADLVAGKGMMNARGATGSSGSGFGTFAAISGGWSKYHTGSHVDVSGLSLIAGLSFGADLAPGRLTLGAFFEYGGGSYDSYNSFGNVDANGNGNMYHYGGGILGRMDFAVGSRTGSAGDAQRSKPEFTSGEAIARGAQDAPPSVIYTEASFRTGGLHNEYRTSALRDIDGNSARGYDAFSPYYGIHFGAGYIWKFTEKASLDLYGKYFWTRQQGTDVRLSTGDPVEFKDVDSHRLRLGGRLAYAINEYIAPYIGAAWEYEFDGRQRATTYGYDIATPTLYGSTGIGELGLTLKPSKDLPLSFDLGVQGYVGKREGVTGSLQVKWEF